jgi:hypothetical protein
VLVGIGVAVRVGRGVRVDVAVLMGLGVRVGAGVRVGLGMRVGSAVWVGVAMLPGSAVRVGLGVSVDVGELVGLRVLIGVAPGVMLWSSVLVRAGGCAVGVRIPDVAAGSVMIRDGTSRTISTSTRAKLRIQERQTLEQII